MMESTAEVLEEQQNVLRLKIADAQDLEHDSTDMAACKSPCA